LPVEPGIHAVAFFRAIEFHPGNAIANFKGNGIGFDALGLGVCGHDESSRAV
jgi:hypothetical protein